MSLLGLLFEGNPIRYKILNNKLWVCARDLAVPLNKGIHAIRTNLQNIRPEWKISIEITTAGGIQNSVFINKPAAIMIILSTRSARDSPVRRFQEWAAVKLDELITTGQTRISNNEFEYKQQELQFKFKQLEYNHVRHTRELEYNHRCHTRDLALKIADNFKYDAILVSASRDYLANEVSGNNNNNTNNKFYDIAQILSMLGEQCGSRANLGKFIANRYRYKYNKEPDKAEKCINGSMRSCNVYHESILPVINEWVVEFINTQAELGKNANTIMKYFKDTHNGQ